MVCGHSYVKAVIFAILAWLALASGAISQEAHRIKGTPAPCGAGLVNNGDGGLLHRAAYQNVDVVARGNVRITFVGHSTYFIETPGGATVATDWSGQLSPPAMPEIVTMNNSHGGHYTDFIEPGIKYPLRGWDPEGGIARHNFRYKDLRIYNVPTNIFGPTNGNSVFVYEAAGLCLAHLGHLHHFLSKEQIHRLGRIDGLFVPADGTVTLSHAEAMHIINQIRPRLILPMHYSLFGAPEEFPVVAGKLYPVRYHHSSTITLNRSLLPAKTEVLYLSIN